MSGRTSGSVFEIKVSMKGEVPLHPAKPSFQLYSSDEPVIAELMTRRQASDDTRTLCPLFENAPKNEAGCDLGKRVCGENLKVNMARPQLS
jgi:hypothetical protein